MGAVREKYTHEYFLPDEPGQNYGVDGYEAFKAGTVYETARRILDEVDWPRKRVLEIGPGRGEALRHVLQKGASSAVAVDFAQAACEITLDTLDRWKQQIAVFNREAIEVQFGDEDFDAVLLFDVVEHIPADELREIVPKIFDWLKPGGLVLWHTPNYVRPEVKTATDLIPQTAGMHCNKMSWETWERQLAKAGFRRGAYSRFVYQKPETERRDRPVSYQDLARMQGDLDAIRSLVEERGSRRSRGTVLHVHNVQRCGGTGNFVWDFARSFPELEHVALCVNDPNGDPAWRNWVSRDMRPMYAPKLTRALVEEIDPGVVILHNTAGQHVESDHRIGILSDRFVIAVHHNPTHPLFVENVDADVFVSNFVLSKYESIVKLMRDVRTIPPCVYDLDQFGPPRPFWKGLRVTSAGKGCERLMELARDDVLDLHPGPDRRGMGVMPGYLRNFNVTIVWSQLEESWCRTVTEAMAAGHVVIAQRIGAIPEQIEDAENGFLFSDEEQLLGVLKDVDQNYDPGALSSIGEAARKWALANAGADAMRLGYSSLLLKALA